MKNNQLDMASLVLQVYNLILLMQDFNNTDLMQELHLQNEKYLKEILKNQKYIINILNERREDNAREVRKEN